MKKSLTLVGKFLCSIFHQTKSRQKETLPSTVLSGRRVKINTSCSRFVWDNQNNKAHQDAQIGTHNIIIINSRIVGITIG